MVVNNLIKKDEITDNIYHFSPKSKKCYLLLENLEPHILNDLLLIVDSADDSHILIQNIFTDPPFSYFSPHLIKTIIDCIKKVKYWSVTGYGTLKGIKNINTQGPAKILLVIKELTSEINVEENIRILRSAQEIYRSKIYSLANRNHAARKKLTKGQGAYIDIHLPFHLHIYEDDIIETWRDK